MPKIYIYTIIVCFLSFALGIFAGVKYVAPMFQEQHYIGTTLEKTVEIPTDKKNEVSVNWR